MAGNRTGFGHPDWLKTHPPAQHTARAVELLLHAGASLVGKTISDELCYSLSGENYHYGTPLNPRARTRIPGGSSSGSASAVAGGAADFALGTDCGGSVRVPASYCGIFGVRPTHGRVSLNGVHPFAPSFDCAGWFALDPDILLQVGRVLLNDTRTPKPFRRLLVAKDAFERADPEVKAATVSHIARISDHLGNAREVVLSDEGLDEWFEAFRIMQAAEIWKSFGDWISTVRPEFGPGVRERFHAASEIRQDELEGAKKRRSEICTRLEELIEVGDVVCLPTTPRPAPLLGTPVTEVEIRQRNQAMALLCVAGLGGLPQINLPVADIAGAPIGLSILARRGTDIDLLAFAKEVTRSVTACPPLELTKSC